MRRLWLLAAVLIAVTGCSTARTPAASPGSSASPKSSATASASAGPRVVLGDYDAGRNPAKDIKAALALAARDHRNVLIDFGADWCLDCRVLTKLSRSGKVATLLSDGYHVVSVDVGEFDRNLDVAATYHLNLQTSGIPALVVLDPKGKVRVATNDGSFANARSMEAGEVADFLSRWSPAAR